MYSDTLDYKEILEELKLEINALIWEYSPATTTLLEAENLSIGIGKKILNGK